MALLLAQLHQRLVDHDPGEPGGELRVTPELVHAPIRLEIGVLQRVLRFRIVLEDRAGDAEQFAVVPAHEHFERCMVALRGAADEIGVVRLPRRDGRGWRCGHRGCQSFADWMQGAAPAFPHRPTCGGVASWTRLGTARRATGTCYDEERTCDPVTFHPVVTLYE